MRDLYKLHILSILILFSSISYSQNTAATICFGESATICAGESVALELCSDPNQTPDTNVIFLGNITEVFLTDDVYSGIVPIGFDFQFYGVTHTDCVIGSNNMISFNTAYAGTGSGYVISNAAPSTVNPLDAIMAPWQDINPSTGGVIGYKTIGTAPNRRFVVVYKDVPVFSSAEPTCSAIVLHETTFEIDIFIDEKPALPGGWNDGAAIEGTQNADGTLADIFPGRNYPTVWAAVNDGAKWTPNGISAYDISTIPYKAYVPDNIAITYGDTEGGTYASGNPLIVTPAPAAGQDSIGYFINYSSCNQTGSAVTSEISWITISTPEVSTTVTPDLCSQSIGTATANVIGNGPFNYQWGDPAGQTTQTATSLSAGGYLITVEDAFGCTGVSFGVIGDTPMSLSSLSTEVSCVNGSDGTATVNISPTPTSVTYLWNDPAAQTTQTAVGLEVGVYTVSILTDEGCTGTIDVTVSGIPPMVINVTNQQDVTCNSSNDGIVEVLVSQGTAPYAYSWDNSTSTGNLANDLVAGDHVLTVTDANGCIQTEMYTISEPSALQISMYDDDFIICPENEKTLSASGIGGSSDYIFTWLEDGVVVGTGESIIVDPTNSTTVYCLQLTEVCGSPMADSCIVATFPAEIIPELSPDITASCVPVEVSFSNTTFSNEIDYTVWDYDDGSIDTIQDLNNAFHAFEDPDIYDITMEITSVFGCKYEREFNDLIEGWPYPKSDFNLNPNPASMFDPTITAYSQSSSDVVTYEWNAVEAKPSYSSLKNPVFLYPEEIADYPIQLIVTNSYGCSDTSTQQAIVQNDVILFAPNSFTPDNDEFNQDWRVYFQGIDIYSYKLQIYNRWGELILESFDADGSWDGTYNGRLVQSGTYLWKIEAKDLNNDQRYAYSGFVNVIR